MQQSSSTVYPSTHRIYAVIVGGLCHLLFVVSIGVMAISLYSGLGSGWWISRVLFSGLDPHGTLSWAIRLLLLMSFPLTHSLLLRPKGRRVLALFGPAKHGTGSALSSTTYVLLASLSLLAVFILWPPTGITLVEFTPPWSTFLTVAWIASWMLLARSMFDSGIEVQSGSLGWCAVLRNRKPVFPPFSQRGTFRVIRQPIYLSFILILWTAPVITADSLFFAIGWSIYLIGAPIWKERRYVEWHGAAFQEYQKRVPYMFPFRR